MAKRKRTTNQKFKREIPELDFWRDKLPVYVIGHNPEEKRRIIEKYKKGGNNNV